MVAKGQENTNTKDEVIRKDDPNVFAEPELISVPKGDFLMGTSNDQVMELVWKEDWATQWHEEGMFLVEQPQHRVSLSDFQIGKFPITNLEYYRFVWQSHYRLPRGWIGFKYAESTEKHPVTGISMHDAEAYCKWLREMTGKPYRLPTEAEWERAARGRDGRIYPWGSDFDPWRCNTLESGIESTNDVTHYSPAGDSPDGVACMSGNVGEWTCSRFARYPYDPNPKKEPGDKEGFVVRGGAWYYSRKLARCAAREVYPPDYLSPALGFRVVLT